MNKLMIAAITIGAGAAAANAQITVTTDQAAFAGAVNVVDDYSSYISAGDPDITLVPGPTTLGDLTYAPSAGAADGDLELRDDSFGSGEPGLFAFLGIGSGFSFTVTAANGLPFDAFGIEVISANSLGGTTITTSNGDDLIVGDVLGDPGTGFVGFNAAAPFNSVTFTVTDPSTFDGIFITEIYANAVPAPGAAGLLGVAGLAAIRRRR